MPQKLVDALVKAYLDTCGGSGKLSGLEGDVTKKSDAGRVTGELRKREKYASISFNNAGVTGNSTYS